MAESPRLTRLLKLACTVGNDFKIPSRKKISGELLDLNFAVVYNENKMIHAGRQVSLVCHLLEMMVRPSNACCWWIFLAYVATHHQLQSPSSTAPTTCRRGGKDVSYIAEVFMDNVAEYDPGKVNTDLFFCDGASNVQKAGKVLMATFPHTFCFHGGEHVMSLFFSSIAWVAQIKVSTITCCWLLVLSIIVLNLSSFSHACSYSAFKT